VGLRVVLERGVEENIFGHKREKVARRWRRLHNEKLHKFCASPSTIREVRSW
jgi:hypothetical protein